MRNIFFLGLILTLSAFWLQAQESNPGNESSRGATDNGQPVTMQGCLQSSGGHYTLRDDNGIVHLLGGDVKTLSHYVGHDIRVTGTRFTKTTDTTISGAASSATERPDLRVQNVRNISDTCSGH